MWLAFFLLWLALAAWLSQRILAKIFPAGWASGLLAFFLPLFLLGPAANFFTAWFKLTDAAVLVSLLAVIAALAALAYFFSRRRMPAHLDLAEPSAGKLPWPVWPIFYSLLIVGACLIGFAASGGHLSSPWQVLSVWYLPVAGAAAAVLFFAIFKQEDPRRVLAGIIMFSLLVHGYLFVYGNGFGGDRFRHLGSEERIISGLEYQPTLLAEHLWWAKFGPISVPQALIDSSKLSYGTQWSLEVIAAKVTGWPLSQINRFMLPLLWSVFLPVIIYLCALLIKPKQDFALLAAQLSSGLYLLQYYGAQGLPASYGLLWLAFILALILSYLRHASRPLTWLIALALALMYFNYSLAFVLALIAFALAWSIKRRPHWPSFAAAVSVVMLLALDYASAAVPALSWRTPLLALISSNLAYFNQASYSFGEWHLLIDLAFCAALASLIVWVAISAARVQAKSWLLICHMFLIIMSAYLLSMSLFSGSHLLARRLTLFAGLPLIFILAALIEKHWHKIKPAAAAGLLAVVFMSVYRSGPVLDISISNDDLLSAQRMLPSVLANPDSCLILPEPVILSLEYLSAKQFQETINDSNCR